MLISDLLAKIRSVLTVATDVDEGFQG